MQKKKEKKNQKQKQDMEWRKGERKDRDRYIVAFNSLNPSFLPLLRLDDLNQ